MTPTLSPSAFAPTFDAAVEPVLDPTVANDLALNPSIEWTRLSTVLTGGTRQATSDDVIDWIKASPLRTKLRVHLRKSTKDRSMNQVRRQLQSIGCTVTSFTTFAADR